MSAMNVYVRFRPVFHAANEDPEETCVRTSLNNTVEMVNLRNTQETLRFEFKQVFDEDSSQEEVFGATLQPLLSRFAEDLQNVSVFAYGPTGSGKTFTILGTDDFPGFIPRTMRHLFARTRQDVISRDTQVAFSMSYIEIYQEKVYDLLGNSKKDLTIRQDENGVIFIPGLSEPAIDNFSDFEKLFVPASRGRRVAKTKINARSSRSHTTLLIKLITQEKKAPFRRRSAKLSIIDLAGSEDNRQTGNQGLRLKESSSINTSLHMLGKVVDALNAKKPRIPYRDSKLTRLLQDSLGGSAHTCTVVNLSPEMSSIFETNRALTFAVKSKRILNKPFTHECIVEPPVIREDEHENHAKCDTTVKPEPIFSPSIKERAKRLKLQIDKFEELENTVSVSKLHTNKTKSPMKSEAIQQSLIEDIRNSSSFFKVLQKRSANSENIHTSQASVTTSNIDEDCHDVESDNRNINIVPGNHQQGKIFTIQVNDNKFSIKMRSESTDKG